MAQYFSTKSGRWLRRLIVASVTLFTVGQNNAWSATLQKFQVGGWTAGAYSEDGSRKFSFCAGTTMYNSGIFVTLVINKSYQWAVGFTNPAWNLQTGSKIDLAYVVDGGQPRPATGRVLAPNRVLIDFGGDAKGFNDFSRGYVLKVAAAQKVFTFNLTDTSKLLPALLNCVNTRMNPAPTVTQAKSNAPAANSDYRAEAAVIAANLLSQAGISGFRLATSGELPEIKADAIWVAQDAIGSINVMPSIQSKDLDEVRSIIIGSDAKSCKGTFFSGSIADDGDQNSQQLTRVFTTCQIKDAPVTNYYIAVPRKAGGMYFIRTMSNGLSEKPAKEADGNIRKAVFTALPK